jgi:hypothetical protein
MRPFEHLILGGQQAFGAFSIVDVDEQDVPVDH